MGCLKLNYCSDATLPKVMYEKSVLSEKSVQIWLSVDPLSDKYPSLSPYAYCMNNPVMLMDPNGKISWPILEFFKKFRRRHESNFGAPRPNKRTHGGLDFNYSGGGNTDLGAPILATHDGVVKKVRGVNDDKDGGGNRITIVSDDGKVSTSYMHLQDKPKYEEGDIIKEGDVIGYMGGSGHGKQDYYAVHLHYELKIDGEKVNPVGADGELIDPQTLITPTPSVNGGTLKEVVVKADKPINNNTIDQ